MENNNYETLGRLTLYSYLVVSRLLHPLTKYTDAPENGEYASYWENGDREVKGYFKDGKFHGTWTFWFPNGQKSWEGFYHEGIQVGKWSEWDENGDVIIELYYRDGEIDEQASLYGV